MQQNLINVVSFFHFSLHTLRNLSVFWETIPDTWYYSF